MSTLIKEKEVHISSQRALNKGEGERTGHQIIKLKK